MAEDRSLVLKRQRRLKWRALDWLEALLMMLCGLTLAGFCVSFGITYLFVRHLEKNDLVLRL